MLEVSEGLPPGYTYGENRMGWDRNKCPMDKPGYPAPFH